MTIQLAYFTDKKVMLEIRDGFPLVCISPLIPASPCVLQVTSNFELGVNQGRRQGKLLEGAKISWGPGEESLVWGQGSILKLTPF